MIDSSPAIEKSKVKTLYYRTNGFTTMICDGKTKEGKWHVIDMAIGSSNMVLNDLIRSGYKLVKI